MTDRVYALHSDDIMSKHVAKIDYSRIDAMIAVRMRMTGHTQENICSMIRENTPRLRQQGSDTEHANDLDRYARRAAAYAFSEEGDKQIKRLQHMQDKWIRLESSGVSQKKPIMRGP